MSRLKPPALAWFATLVLLVAGPVRGEDWTIDARASAATFRVRLFGLLPLGGGFSDLAGSIRVDRAAGQARVDATLDATSAVMPNPSHTLWVRGEEFFDVERYPEIRFRSKAFPLAVLTDGGDIAGRLTVRARTKRVTFTIEPAQCDVSGDAACSVEVVGSIRRGDFGMETRRGTLSDRVTLRFTIVARREPGS